MEYDIPFGNSNRENGTTFLDFPLFLGIFLWDEPTKRVPFTAEPEIPEILTKWKAPNISQQCWELLRPFARSLKLNGLKTQDLDCKQSLFFFRFSEQNARAGSGEAARSAKRPVSRHQSRAWLFACLAFCSTDYRKKRDCS